MNRKRDFPNHSATDRNLSTLERMLAIATMPLNEDQRSRLNSREKKQLTRSRINMIRDQASEEGTIVSSFDKQIKTFRCDNHGLRNLNSNLFKLVM